MDFSCAIRVELGGTIVRVDGDVDVLTAPQLREQFADLVRRRHYDLIVDLEAVTSMDSTGVAVLVNARKRARAHDGSLHVVCSSDEVLQTFRAAGLTQTFPIHATTAAALAAIESRATPPGLWATPPRRLSAVPARNGPHAQ